MSSAVILAAGVGSRLGRATSRVPKPMIPLAGKPILQHTIEQCREANIRSLFINLHHCPEQIRGHFGNGRAWGVSISYALEKRLRGTGGAVRHFLPYLGRKPFYVLYGDNWFEKDFKNLSIIHRRQKADLTIGLIWKDDIRHSGWISLDQRNRVTQFIEKPQGPKRSGWVNAGVYVLNPQLAKQIPRGVSDFGKDLIPQWLKEGRRIFGVKLKGRLLAIDTPALLRQSIKSVRSHD